MRSVKALIPLFLLLMLVSCQPAEQAVQPPVAKIEAKELEIHGDVRVDNYYWLKERENPEVIAYLTAENDYTAKMMANTEDFQEKLFEEIKGRIKQTDESVPYFKNGYWYYSRFEEGKEYAIYCRKAGTLEAEEEIMVDSNMLAEGHPFFSIRGLNVSTDNKLLAYGVDTVGRRFYTISFMNIESGEMYDDVIPDVTGNVAWANDNKTVFYGKQDPETLRSFQIYLHELGSDPAGDALIYQEDDDTFEAYVWKTKSDRYIIIASQQTLAAEYRFLDADNPSGEFTLFMPREREHEYSIDHFGDYFYIVSNWDAQNFRLLKTPVTATAQENWEEVIPHREDVLLEGIEIFKDYLVLQERKNGLNQIRIAPWDGGEEHYIDFGEPAYMAYVSTNPEFDTPVVRYRYSSLTTPWSTYDYNMASREQELMKRDEVLGDFDPANYTTERLWATARDGVKVPISLVYKTELMKKDGTNPLLLYAYGSYGSSTDATFSSIRLTLVDRGVSYAIAHVRGGQELGRWWYDDGKLLKKKNTFTDFIDCAKYLCDEDYTYADGLFAQGGSAGGLLMGAIANMAPEQFKGILAHVPWVDVITTMLDPSIPLTTSEYDEWGNPNDKVYYDYMLSYSPYDQVEAKAYPNMLVTTSLHDSQVQYFEPAKWVAKLRALKTDDNRLLLRTNMEAGHGGASGRFKRYRDYAFYYAFMFDLLGITQ